MGAVRRRRKPQQSEELARELTSAAAATRAWAGELSAHLDE